MGNNLTITKKGTNSITVPMLHVKIVHLFELRFSIPINFSSFIQLDVKNFASACFMIKVVEA